MSLTILQQPSLTLVSAGNDNVYTISGNTLVAPNVFEYKYIADVYVNGVFYVTMKSFPDINFGFGVFNTRNLLAQTLGFDFFAFDDSPIQIFKNCPNMAAIVSISFGEEYLSGNTFVQNKNQTSGNTSTYLNSSLPFLTQNGGLDNYFALNGNLGRFFLTANNNQAQNLRQFVANTYTTQRQFLYYSNDIVRSNKLVGSTMDIVTRNASGTRVGQYRVVTPILLSGATAVQCLAVGYEQLSKLTSGQTTVIIGSWPIFQSNVTQYDITLDAPPVSSGITDTTEWLVPRYQIQTDCGRTAAGAYLVYWMNEYGAFESWLFNKKNETTLTKKTKSYQRKPGKLSANGSFTIATSDGNDRIYYTIIEDEIVMNTDLLSDNDVIFLKTLVSSPVVYIQAPNGVVTYVTVKTDSYRIVKKVNQKTYALELTVTKSVNDFRQIL